MSGITFAFSEPMEPASFTVDDVVTFTGPSGDLKPQVTGITGSGTTYTVNFAEQTVNGRYSIVVGPYILDLAGNPLNQDGDGIAGETVGDRYTFVLGTRYYVNDGDTTDDFWATAPGDDANDGLTPGTPKATIHAILAAYDLEPNDEIRVDAGTYLLAGDIVLEASDSGDSTANVTIRGVPGKTILDRGTSGSIFHLYGKYYAIEGMILLNGDYGLRTTTTGYDPILLRNNVFASQKQNGFYLYRGDATLLNNTFYAVDAHGIYGGSSSLTVRNNIFHVSGTGKYAVRLSNVWADPLVYRHDYDYNDYFVTNGARVGYYLSARPDLPAWQAAIGEDVNSLSADPLFADPAGGDFHLKSNGGRYDPASGTWAIDSVNSPAIDAGDPASAYVNEPAPHGGRINLGAYGNTAMASKTDRNPRILTLIPADDAVLVPPDTDLAIVSDEPIQAGAGSIILRRAADHSVVEEIAVPNLDPDKVKVDGATVTIRLANSLPRAARFYVEVAAGTFADLAGNDLAGITGPAAWNFETFAEVIDRWIFYNNSFYDGNDPAANAGDFSAVVPHTPISGGHGPHPTGKDQPALELGKNALLPGQTAAFANYTSYSKGINGVMVDVAGLADTPTAADFQFLVGNHDDPANWAAAPNPASIDVFPGAGTLDSQGRPSDRITIIWADRTIQNTWLQITVLATAATGLPEADVFYFGNAVGDSGAANPSEFAFVTVTDELAARAHPHNFQNPASISDPCDFNKDSFVTVTDELVARNHGTNFLNALRLITVPESPAGGMPLGAAAGAESEGSHSGLDGGSAGGALLAMADPHSLLAMPAAGRFDTEFVARGFPRAASDTPSAMPRADRLRNAPWTTDRDRVFDAVGRRKPAPMWQAVDSMPGLDEVLSLLADPAQAETAPSLDAVFAGW